MRKPKTPAQKQHDREMRARKDKALRDAGLVPRAVWATREQHELEAKARVNTESGRLYVEAMNSLKGDL